MESRKEINQAIRNYINSRREFLSVADRNKRFLAGNDNIVGRIGEYIAIRLLEKRGISVNKAVSKSEKGYDLLLTDGRKVSVKLITAENVRGSTTRIKSPWDMLILIELNSDYEVHRLGILTRSEFRKALGENKNWSSNPVTKRSMLGANGLFGQYGEIIAGFRYLD